MVGLHDGDHPTLSPEASDSRSLEERGRTRRTKTPKCSCLKWLDTACWVSETWASSSSSGPRTSVSPALPLVPWPHGEKVKPSLLNMEQHNNPTFSIRQRQRKRRHQLKSQNVSVKTKWSHSAYAWHFIPQTPDLLRCIWKPLAIKDVSVIDQPEKCK